MGETESKYEVKAAPYFIGAAGGIVLVWGWYFLEHYTNWRITSLGGSASERPIPILFPLIASPLVLIITAIFWRRAVGIARNGVPVTARVSSVGAAVQGMRNVELYYSFEGSRYTRKTSVSCATSDRLKPGDALDVIVDKRNPRRVLVK